MPYLGSVDFHGFFLWEWCKKQRVFVFDTIFVCFFEELFLREKFILYFGLGSKVQSSFFANSYHLIFSIISIVTRTSIKILRGLK